jgi:DNA-binding MarR family transcriptional regulator
MVDDFSDSTAHVFAALERLRYRSDADMRRLVPRSIEGLRGSQARLLDMIAVAGSRPSELAEGAWISKQAVGQRLREMEERGWVSITPDPSDGRAVVVRRTRAGDRVRKAALATITSMEQEWAEQVGADRYAIFRAVVDELGQHDQ